MGQRTWQLASASSGEHWTAAAHAAAANRTGGRWRRCRPDRQAPPTQTWGGGQCHTGPPAGGKSATEYKPKEQTLSGNGDPSPSKRAGANPNPGLTLALASAKSPNASKGGHSRASTAPQGEGRMPKGPRNQAVRPPKAGKGEGTGA
jgi:hypothetical protein